VVITTVEEFRQQVEQRRGGADVVRRVTLQS